MVTPESPVSVILSVLNNNSASSVGLGSHFSPNELPVPEIEPVFGNNYVTSELPVPVVGGNSEPVPQQKRNIYVHRLNIKRDMIDLFRDPSIMGQDIEIIVIDARGVEEVGRGVGVLRDVFSLFWKET